MVYLVVQGLEVKYSTRRPRHAHERARQVVKETGKDVVVATVVARWSLGFKRSAR